MRYEDLSPADQQLLNTDLGEVEKVAAEKIALADEMYSTGFNKLATEAADAIEATYAEKTAASEDVSMDDESEKVASDLGSFIERGFFDGLRKLGSDRYGDEMAYLNVLIEEKVAQAGAAAALDKLASKTQAVKEVAEKGPGLFRKGWDKTKAAVTSETGKKVLKGTAGAGALSGTYALGRLGGKKGVLRKQDKQELGDFREKAGKGK